MSNHGFTQIPSEEYYFVVGFQRYVFLHHMFRSRASLIQRLEECVYAHTQQANRLTVDRFTYLVSTSSYH